MKTQYFWWADRIKNEVKKVLANSTSNPEVWYVEEAQRTLVYDSDLFTNRFNAIDTLITHLGAKRRGLDKRITVLKEERDALDVTPAFLQDLIDRVLNLSRNSHSLVNWMQSTGGSAQQALDITNFLNELPMHLERVQDRLSLLEEELEVMPEVIPIDRADLTGDDMESLRAAIDDPNHEGC